MSNELILMLSGYIRLLEANAGNKRLSQNGLSRMREVIKDEILHYVISNLSSLPDEDLEALGITRKEIHWRYGVAG